MGGFQNGDQVGNHLFLAVDDFQEGGFRKTTGFRVIEAGKQLGRRGLHGRTEKTIEPLKLKAT